MLPWRLHWAVHNIFKQCFWKKMFSLTKPMPKHVVVFNIFRLLFSRTNTSNISKKPVELIIDELGEILLDSFSDLFIFCEVFVDECYKFPELEMVSPTVVDIGANIGMFALYMKERYPDSQITCFEPMPRNFERLERNVKTAQLKQVYCLQEGVSSTDGELPLFIHSSNTGGHSIVMDGVGSKENAIIVKIVSLRNVLSRIPKNQIDLLKLDCEGCERDIIFSLDKNDAQQIKAIICEPTSSLYSVKSLISHLEAIGYHVLTNQGLLFARRKFAVPQ